MGQPDQSKPITTEMQFVSPASRENQAAAMLTELAEYTLVAPWIGLRTGPICICLYPKIIF